MFGSDGNGTLKLWRDGVQIVNYTGPLGGEGGGSDAYYWKEGVYRAPGGTNTMAADYSNLQITTGPAPVPAPLPQQTLGGTPPSSSTSSSGDDIGRHYRDHFANHANHPTTPTTPTTPSTVTRPVLTVADDSLWVAGRGGTVDLGVNVTRPTPTIS